MHRTVAFLVAMLAACALAAPTPKNALTKRLGSFKMATRGRQNLHRDSRSEMARTYRKYGWDITILDPSTGQAWDAFASPQSTTSAGGVPSSTSIAQAVKMQGTGSAASTAAAAASTAIGEVKTDPEPNESEYLSPVSIGGQTLTLDFDTGSADLWVFSTKLPANEIGGHAAFDPSKSSTFSEYHGGSWQISYGDGSAASGSVGFDEVKIGDLTVQKQAIELASNVSSMFVSDVKNDGIVGLGFSVLNTIKPQPQKTFFENIMNDLDKPLFTADLGAHASGTYEFGTIDKSKCIGDVMFTTVDTSQGFWQFESSTYTIAGKPYTNTTASPAIADTGTSLILVDGHVAQAYYSQIPGAQMSSSAGGYVYPCNANVPAFGIQIGNSGYTAEISGKDLTFSQVNSQTCFGGVQSNGGAKYQIIGDMLLKHYFAVFHGGKLSFGLAPKSAAAASK